jgi:hypothetical protein
MPSICERLTIYMLMEKVYFLSDKIFFLAMKSLGKKATIANSRTKND